jgi:hypothetical protein
MSKYKFPRTLFALILTFICLTGTSMGAPGEDWRPVDPADLALKEPKVEKDADAEALFWEVRVDDSGEGDLVFSHYLRVKIFTERGKESQSKIDIPFGKIYGRSIKIKDIAARTIKPDGTIILVNEKDVFERDQVRASGVKIKVKTFAMPGVEPGAIIEYKWRETMTNTGAHYLRLQFQRDIPVQLVKYYFKPRGYTNYGMRLQMFQGVNSPLTKEKNGFHSTTMTNMPAFREEPRMPPEDQARTWMLIYYTPEILLRIPPSLFWGLWGIIMHDVHKPDLKVNDEVKRATAEATAGATTPEDKLKKIDEFVRARIKNVQDDALEMSPEEKAKVKTNKSPSDTLKRGQGTGEDIDMLFGAMAIASGMEARVVELPDRSQIFFDRNFPDRYYMRLHAIAVKVGEDWKFFSPSSTYLPMGMLPWRAEGQDGVLLDSKDAGFVKTPLSAPDKSMEKRTAKLRLNEDGTLEGKVTVEYYGHAGADKKEYNDDEGVPEREELLRNMIKERLSTAEVTNVRVENVTDPVKPFTYSFDIRIPGYAQRTGKRLFIQPAFFQKGLEPLFKTSERRYPIYFHYPWSEQDNVTIDLPKGYVLDNADAPQPFAAGTISKYTVKIQAAKDGSFLIYDRNFYFGGDESIIFPTSSYGQLKKYFDVLHERDNHTITLKQATASN